METRPLRDDNDGGDADDKLLGRLMRSVGPLPSSELRKRRVLASMRARLAARDRRRPMLRTAMAAGALLIIGGVAGATIGRSAWDRLVSPAPPAPSSLGPAAPAAATVGTRSVGQLAAPSAIPAPAAAVAPASPARLNSSAHGEDRPAPRIRRSARADEARGDSLAPPAPLAPIATDEEDAPTLLVMAAKKALANNDPARARVLLDDYLAHNPDGQLAEGALVLAMQAAAAQDDPEAATLARRYLARYPMGQFSEAARQAIARYSHP